LHLYEVELWGIIWIVEMFSSEKIIEVETGRVIGTRDKLCEVWITTLLEMAFLSTTILCHLISSFTTL
jgi:hypothetical protein